VSWSLSRAIGYRNQMLTATLVPSADSNRSKSGKYEADGCGLWRYLYRTGIRRDGDDDEKNKCLSDSIHESRLRLAVKTKCEGDLRIATMTSPEGNVKALRRVSLARRAKHHTDSSGCRGA